MFKPLFALAVVALAAVPAVAAPVVYDAFTSFDGTQGAGNFYYGTLDLAGGPDSGFFGNTGPCAIDGTTCLQWNAGEVPGVYKTLGGAFDSVLHPSVSVPGDRLILYPGSDDAVTFIVFVAPKDSNYHLTSTFSIQDKTPTGVAVTEFVLSDYPEIADRQLLGSGSFSDNGSGFLRAGDLVGFILDNDGDSSNDSTGVNMTMTAVPEPATWSLMIAGFAMVGLAVRRRQLLAA